jgi:hypothetical protein
MPATITLTAAEAIIARQMVMSCLIATERTPSRPQPWQLLVDRNDAHSLLAKLLESTAD